MEQKIKTNKPYRLCKIGKFHGINIPLKLIVDHNTILYVSNMYGDFKKCPETWDQIPVPNFVFNKGIPLTKEDLFLLLM